MQSKIAPPLSPSSKRQRPKASPHQEKQPRELPEYKAAVELELWKEQQEEMFKTMVYLCFMRFVFESLLIFVSILPLMVNIGHNFVLFSIFFI